jgi:tetratricopeptide (TPR) repeat protein
MSALTRKLVSVLLTSALASLIFALSPRAARAQDAPSQSAPPEAVQHLLAGTQSESRNDLDGAIREFTVASQLAPAYDIAFLDLGDAYMRKRDYASALAPLKKAVELNPDSTSAHRLLGFALLAQGYAAEAIPHLDRAGERGALGIAQIETNDYANAVANLQAALAKTPSDPDLLFYLSRASEALSSQSIDALLSAHPDSPRAHQIAGQHFFSTKEIAKSEHEYEAALKLRPDLPNLRMELAEVYSSESNWPKAVELLRDETKLQPGSAEAAYRLGDALMHQGDMKESAAEFERSDKLRPDMPETLYALGKSSLATNPALAEKSLTRVLDLEKDTPLAAQTYKLLAALHRRQGKAELAVQETKEFERIQQRSAPQ